MADPLTAFGRNRTALHRRVIEALVRLFLGLADWRDPQQFVSQAVPLIQGAQTALTALTDAYIAAVLSRDLDTPVPPAGVDPGPIIAATRGEVTAEQVYARPFHEVWTALGEGRRLSEAVEFGANRAREVAEVDLQITHAHAARDAMLGSPARARIIGWRRVLKGETSCALCVIASTQRYTVEQLNPIHPGCDCEVLPVTGTDRQVIDRKLLDAAQAATKDLLGFHPSREQLRDVLLSITREHGEHGAVLVNPRHRFTGSGDVPTTI